MDTSFLIHELHQKVRMLTKEANDRLVEHGMYSSQWSILFCLKRFGPLTQTEIWKYLNVEAPTVTRTLARLEEGGWISRTAGEDKRERVVTLTDQAIQQLPFIEQTMYQFEQDMTSELSQEEQQQLLHLLKKIGNATSHTRKEKYSEQQ